MIIHNKKLPINKIINDQAIKSSDNDVYDKNMDNNYNSRF